MQHKREAWWFYRFLSIFYDKYVNPLFWTDLMRDQSLRLARLDAAAGLSVVDVGSGTGFTTEGIVQHVPAAQVYCIDQSPHQMARARAKTPLRDCHFELGDAENLPFDTDRFDRYVSAGSIEYWPDPARGIREAYRVLKPGGIALLIGPLQPANRLARFIADTWMLFPSDREYRDWFAAAGFQEVQTEYIRPQWYRNRKGEYGVAIAGTKPAPGVSPAEVAAAAPEPEKMSPGRRLQLFGRVLIGSLAGFLFIPIALFGYLRRAFTPAGETVPPAYRERLNSHQIAVLFGFAVLVGVLIWMIF